jgi:PAS domain S-box-containing protein
VTAAIRTLPRPARLLLSVVVGAGAAVTAWRAVEAASWSTSDLAGWGVMSLGILLGELFPVAMRHGDEEEEFLMTDVAFAAGLLLAPLGVLTLAVGAGILVASVVRRTAPHKAAFNVGQDLVAITVAGLVATLVGRHDPADPMTWLAVAAGMAAYFAVNETLMAWVISLVERLSFVEVLTGPIALSLLQWAGNVALGIVAGVLLVTTPRLLPLLLVPLGLSYLAYRGWQQSAQERDRMRNLYEAERALFGPLDTHADFAAFLPLAARMFGADRVEVVVVDDGVVAVHGPEGTVTLTASGAGRTEPDAFVRAVPGLVVSTAPIEQGRGVLAVSRNRPLSETERDLLATLASQVRVRLQNTTLFSETIDQRAQLSEIVRGASDGILAVDEAGRIQWWNAAMERMTGIAAEEALATTWDAVFAGMSGAVGQGDRWGGLGEVGTEHGFQLVRRDGKTRWIRYTASPMSGRDGGPEGRVVVVRDVTAEMEADELKADFLATVSHELRTPLTPLKGYLSALAGGSIDDSPEARAEYYRIMSRQVDRLEHLITDLLDAATIESHRASVRLEVVELTSLVSSQVEELAHADPDRPIELHTPGMPVVALADPFRVEQVVGNLLSNARKYSPPDTRIEVTVSTTPDQALVVVRDEGPGIPSSEQERVFQRFQRLEHGLVREAGGTGLGLFIARQLVEAMGGRIWLLSRPGSGSSFCVSLPLAEPAAQPSAADGADLRTA